MSTQTQSVSPASQVSPVLLGLSLHVIAGPRGEVRDDNWPCIAYNLDLRRGERVIWSGPYFLGVGHVKTKIAEHEKRFANLGMEERSVCDQMARGVMFRKDPKTSAIVAGVAARLAKAQKVTPKLEDVLSSLLLDGSAYFDAQRFEDWAADLGYDPDSRKAEATWRACDETGRALARAFTAEELAGLREWASNY